jgi:hypothetical protein
MKITQRKKEIAELFFEKKFKNCDMCIREKFHTQSNGFYLNEKHYYFCDTLILYQWERPDGFKVAFCNQFLRELEIWLPFRGKKQFFRDWLFDKKFPEFEHKELLRKKFFFYK